VHRQAVLASDDVVIEHHTALSDPFALELRESKPVDRPSLLSSLASSPAG